MKNFGIILMAAISVALSACGGLSSREKEMVGSYFISEISDIEPLYELNADGTSAMHAIRSEIVSFWVEGTWKVSGDKLIIVNDTTKVHVNGDKSLVGNIPERVEYEIIDYNGTILTLVKKGVKYEYHRRPPLEQDSKKSIDINSNAQDPNDEFVDEPIDDYEQTAE